MTVNGVDAIIVELVNGAFVSRGSSKVSAMHLRRSHSRLCVTVAADAIPLFPTPR